MWRCRLRLPSTNVLQGAHNHRNSSYRFAVWLAHRPKRAESRPDTSAPPQGAPEALTRPPAPSSTVHTPTRPPANTNADPAASRLLALLSSRARPQDVRDAYLALRAAHATHHLSARDMSALLAFFGEHEYWFFVIALEQDMKTVQKAFGARDRVWALRAHVGSVVANTPAGGVPPPRVRRSLDQARAHLRRLPPSLADEQLRLSYTQMLLLWRMPDCTAEAADILAAMQFMDEPTARQALVQLVNAHVGSASAPRIRRNLDQARALFRRLQPSDADRQLRLAYAQMLLSLRAPDCATEAADVLAGLKRIDGPTARNVVLQLGSVHDALCDALCAQYDDAEGMEALAKIERVFASSPESDEVGEVNDLARALVSASPFAEPSHDVAGASKSWAVSAVCAALHPSRPGPARWWTLVLLAHAGSSAPPDAFSASAADAPDTPWAWTECDVVLALSSLGSASLPSEELAFALWDTWTVCVKAPPSISHGPVQAAVLAHFLRLAAHIRSRRLFLLAFARARESKSDPAVERALLLAHAVCADPETELNALPAVARDVLPEALAFDVRAAYRVYNSAPGAQHESGVLGTLARGLVAEGLISGALRVLWAQRSNIKAQDTHVALRGILDALEERRSLYFVPDEAGLLADVLELYFRADLRTKVWAALGRGLRYVLPVIARSRHPAKAFAIVKAIAESHPGYFSSGFYHVLRRTLIEVRAFELAVRLVRIGERCVPPAEAVYLRTRLVRRLRRHGPLALVRREEARLTDAEVALTQPSDTDKVAALASAGRMHEARVAFAHIRKAKDRRTARSALVHAALHHHNTGQRRFRAVLRAIRKARHEGGLDRVRLNILLGAVVRWPTRVSAERLRVLFDELVWCGYGADPPFGTRVRRGLGVRAMPERVSLGRHVLPMYKMFISGFRARGDVDAARVVVGMLKKAEAEMVRAREERERARRDLRRARVYSGAEKDWKR